MEDELLASPRAAKLASGLYWWHGQGAAYPHLSLGFWFPAWGRVTAVGRGSPASSAHAGGYTGVGTVSRSRGWGRHQGPELAAQSPRDAPSITELWLPGPRLRWGPSSGVESGFRTHRRVLWGHSPPDVPPQRIPSNLPRTAPPRFTPWIQPTPSKAFTAPTRPR